MSKVFLIARLLVIGILVAGLDTQSHAENRTANDTPVQRYLTKVQKLKDSLAGLPKQIDEARQRIQRLTSPATAKTQLDQLRGDVSIALRNLADNGPVSELGDTALKFAQRKLNEMEADTHFSPDQRNNLINQWKDTYETTSNAVKALNEIRKQLVHLLEVTQANEDYIKQQEELHNAAQAIAALQKMTAQMQDISNKLRDILQHTAT
jgi:prefoldin subunit 5